MGDYDKRKNRITTDDVSYLLVRLWLANKAVKSGDSISKKQKFRLEGPPTVSTPLPRPLITALTPTASPRLCHRQLITTLPPTRV